MRWIQFAALSGAAGTLLVRRACPTLLAEAVAVAVWRMAIGALFCRIVAPLVEPRSDPFRFRAALWWVLDDGVLVNHVYPQVIWFSLARYPPPMGSDLAVIAVPLVGLAAGALTLAEQTHARDVAAAACVVLAIAAARWPPRAQRSQSPDGPARQA